MSRKYKFTEKTHSKRAFFATLASGTSLLVYALAVGFSAYRHGEENIYLGAIGIFFLLVALLGFSLAVQSLREENSFRRLPIVSLFLSILACGLWILSYCLGFTLFIG